MRQTTYITLNLQTPNYATVYAARDNLLSRYVSATLLDGAAPWTPPAGTYAEISYIKPDGTGGYYDTVEDGNLAYAITNNVVEFVLAQQALTVPGDVRMALDFFNADGGSLSTFTFVLTVPENSFPYAQLASGNYFNVMQATLAEMAQYIKTLQDGYGAPLVASTVADMTDTSRVYVYTGSETGYTNGNWYYWDGSAWVSGGIYNSTAFTTDKTLTISGAAADAEATGKAITEVSKTADAVYTQRVYGTTDTGLFLIQSGGLDWSNGTNKTDTKRARTATAGWDIDGTTRFILDNNNYNFAVMYYRGTPGSGTYISNSGWVDNGSIIAEKAGAKKVRLQFIRKDEASMTSADYDAISAALMRYDAIREIAVDDTLTIAGAAADAKSTGDKITTLTDSIDPLFATAYDAMHVAVGRLGTLGGINNTIRWCAYTQVLWDIPEGATALKIVCPGYYFKLLEYETGRIGTSNVPVWYNTGYAYNTLTAPIADTAKFIGINVCKEEGSETALTADDLSDIDAKLVVLANTAISQTGDDIALCTDSIGVLQAHGKQNIVSLPVCYFPASYESQNVMTYALGSGTEAGYNSTQGMCGDHKRYVWVSCKRRNSIDTEPVTIVKYDTVTGEVVQAVSEREYGHINDMCYVEDTNEIYILSWVTDDVDNYYPAGTYDRISVVDADTLLWKRDFGLKDILGEPGVNVDLPSLSAITYNTTFKLFAGVIKPHDVDGVSTKGIVTWTLDGNFDRWRSFPARFEPGYTNFTTSGMDCDNQCLYCLFGYRLYYFDWQTLKPIGKTPDNVLSDVEAALDATQEAESVSVFKDFAFINANNYQSHSDRTIPQVTLYKSNPKTMQFLSLQSLLDALQG